MRLSILAITAAAEAAVPGGYNDTYGYPDGIGGLIIEGPFYYPGGPATWNDTSPYGAYGLIIAPGKLSDGHCQPIPSESPLAKAGLHPVKLTNGVKDCLVGCSIESIRKGSPDPCHAASLHDPKLSNSAMSCFDVGPGTAEGAGVCGYNCTALNHNTGGVCKQADFKDGACNIFCDSRKFPTV